MATRNQPFDEAGARRLMIFGHPSHELALFGTIRRHQPDIIIITDGGGPDRVRQSRDGLDRIGALERTRYLDYAESSFYEALLEGDTRMFREIARILEDEIAARRPRQVFCDAVEFYNPVHDVTLPMVRAALRRHPGASVYEVPLVYQEAGGGEVFRIQRVPPSLADRRVAMDLTPEELAVKRHARDEIYRNLREQAGPEFMELSNEHLAREEMLASDEQMPLPGAHGRHLRYEERGRLLKAQGAVDRVITFADHYVPAVRSILAA